MTTKQARPLFQGCANENYSSRISETASRFHQTFFRALQAMSLLGSQSRMHRPAKVRSRRERGNCLKTEELWFVKPRLVGECRRFRRFSRHVSGAYDTWISCIPLLCMRFPESAWNSILKREGILGRAAEGVGWPASL